MAEKVESVPENEFDTWLTPPEAIAALDGVGRYDTICHALTDRLSAGLARAAAETYQTDEYRDGTHLRALIPKGVWEKHGPSPGYSNFWQTGQFKYTEREYPRDTHRSYFGVRFDPAGIDAQLRAAGINREPVAAPGAKPTKLRGAPRKDWWDHLWIEMIRRIRAGTLNPKNKTELQSILEDCVDEIGGNYGDSTLKPTASNLFEYLEEIRGK